MGHEVIMEGTTTYRVGRLDASDASRIIDADGTSFAWHGATHSCSIVNLFVIRQVEVPGF